MRKRMVGYRENVNAMFTFESVRERERERERRRRGKKRQRPK